MKKLIAFFAVTTALVLAWAATAHAGTAFFKYERETGMTKQCVYDYLGSEYTITIQSHQLCPLSINVP